MRDKGVALVLGLLLAVVLVGCGESKSEEMVRKLDSEEASVRRAACMRLGTLGSSWAYEPVRDVYEHDSSLEVRADCLEALGTVGATDDVLPILTRALEHDSDTLVLHAARGLGKRGSSRGVEPLTAMLEHEHPEVREAAASSLEEIGDPSALPALRDRLEVEENEKAGLMIENAIYLIEAEA